MLRWLQLALHLFPRSREKEIGDCGIYTYDFILKHLPQTTKSWFPCEAFTNEDGNTGTNVTNTSNFNYSTKEKTTAIQLITSH